MPKHRNIEQKRVYNSIVKIITTTIEYDFKIPMNINQQNQAIGAGFFFNSKGYILTAAHVLSNVVDIWVKIPEYGQKIFKANIVSVYPDFDIGIIRIPNFNNKYWLILGNSDKLPLREEVYAVGYPSNSDYPIMTTGTISGKRDYFIQTDTSVNPGNSGGPVLNKNNDVIGITSAIIALTESQGLIIPISIIKTNLAVMQRGKKKIIHKNVTGLYMVNGTDNYSEMYDIKGKCTEGIIIKRVLDKSPLFGKLDVGDLICGFNDGHNEYKLDFFGETDASWDTGKVSIDILVSRCAPNKQVTLNIYSIKDNKEKKVVFNLKSQDEIYPVIKLFPNIDKIDYETFGGLILMNLCINHLEREEFLNLTYLIDNQQIFKPQLVITHIFPNSKIAEYDTIQPQTLIESINGIKVRTLDEFRNAIKKPIIKNNKYYILIQTSNNDQVILNIKELLEKENELMQIYNYKPTSIYNFYKKLLN